MQLGAQLPVADFHPHRQICFSETESYALGWLADAQLSPRRESVRKCQEMSCWEKKLDSKIAFESPATSTEHAVRELVEQIGTPEKKVEGDIPKSAFRIRLFVPLYPHPDNS